MPLFKQFELVTEEFTAGYDDGRGNALTVESYEQLPSANFGPALRDYLLTIPRIRGFFRDQVNYYSRQDYEVRTLPSLNINPISEAYSGSYGWLNGKHALRVIAPVSSKREVVVDRVMRMTNFIFEILNGHRLDVFGFMSPYVLGLVGVGQNMSFSYRNAFVLENGKQVDAYIADGIADYRINMLEYYDAIATGPIYTGANVHITLEE